MLCSHLPLSIEQGPFNALSNQSVLRTRLHCTSNIFKSTKTMRNYSREICICVISLHCCAELILHLGTKKTCISTMQHVCNSISDHTTTLYKRHYHLQGKYIFHDCFYKVVCIHAKTHKREFTIVQKQFFQVLSALGV